MRKQLKYLIKLIKEKFDLHFGHNKFRVEKKYNSIILGKNTQFKYCDVIVRGKNNSVIFGDHCCMTGLHILIEGENNTIKFGNSVIVNASRIQPTVINAIGGTNIIIGKESLFSNNIEIHSSDYHGIYNKQGERINPDKDIVIGENVWIGLGCKILKGTTIANGSIVGAGSVVSGNFCEKNIILAGNPAKTIKKQVFWDFKRTNCRPVPNDFGV